MAAEAGELLRQAQALLAARRPAEARPLFEKLVALQPGNASLRHGLALALKASGEHEAAGNSFAAALALKPDYWEAAFNLGVMLEEDGEATLAELAYRKALAADPRAVRALGNLGNLLRRASRLAEAESFLRRAVDAAPQDAGALGNLSLLYIDAGRFREARSLAERAAALAPKEAAWAEAAGTAARLMSDAGGAIPHLERAARLAPQDAGPRFELALALAANGDDALALAALAEARRIAPGWEKLRWAEALHLPAIVDDEREAAAAVERFDRGLAALEATLRLDTPRAIEDALEAAMGGVPFNLHYLPGEHEERQARYAALVERVARAALPGEPRAPAGSRIRVGFVSGYLCRHVVTRFFVGSIAGLDAATFERFAWHTGSDRDETTAMISAGVDHFSAATGEPREIARAIREAALDILVFPDIGLDPLSHVLASLRLAPTQVALYGHPVTSGHASIDYFVSGDALEPSSAEAHYRERLVRVPGLGARPMAPVEPGDASWARRLRADGRPMLVCAQNLQKVQPAFDGVLARIAAASHARVVFFDRAPGLTRRFTARLRRAFDRAGADAANQIHVEPSRPYRDFVAGLQAADLVLDTPGFSGGATSLDALGVGAPVLAFEGDRARSRQTSAMLRLVGAPELIARDADQYARLACELVADGSRRAALSEKIRRGLPALFEDTKPTEAFAEFLRNTALARRRIDPN